MSLREQVLARKPRILKMPLADGIDVYARLLSYDSVKILVARQKELTDDFGNLELMIDWIIAAAVEEDGTIAFTESDREALRQQDTQFLISFGGAVIKANTPTVEQLEKNS